MKQGEGVYSVDVSLFGIPESFAFYSPFSKHNM